jgi:homoserine O-acetyltransferase
MLGSSYGSTSPASIDPRSGKRYGPDFPEISVVDIVTAQKRLIEHLGIKHLVAVAGPSYGGYQAFQWGVTFPEAMSGLVAAVSAPKGMGGEAAVTDMVASLAKDPNWNGGWYYDHGGILPTMTALRIATLMRYGIDAQLSALHPDPARRTAAIKTIAETWAREFDANGMVALRRASVRFNAEKDLGRIKAKLLYVLSSTDRLFPPSLAPEVMAALKAAGVDAEYFQLESDYGHLAAGRDAAKWAPVLRRFMDGLPR